MLDRQNRLLITEALGQAVDELVADLYTVPVDGPSITQEPEMTSRICQRVEDRLDGQRVGDYIFRVIAQSMPDRGPRSLEKITGADLFLSVSLDGPEGFDKGLFVQAKYDYNIDRGELLDASRRMERQADAKGCYVWVYKKEGVKVFSSHQIRQMRGSTLEGLHPRSMTGLTARILDCYVGTKAWGIPQGPRRRDAVRARLHEVRIDNSLDVSLKLAR